MKKLFFTIGLIFNTCILFAQTPAIPKKVDSIVKANKPIPIIRPNNGDAMMPANDIVTNIDKSKELSTFLKVMQLTGLVETLKSKGPITVFVPTDQAFAKLSQGKLDTLLMPGNKYNLIALVSYHALPGKITSKDIVHEINAHKGLATFITIAGSKLMAKLDDNRNLVLIDGNGRQSVISRFDIQQNNGLIHIIDTVLIPKFKDI